MKRIVLNKFADISGIKVEDFEIKSLLPNEVIVEHKLIGFNPVDYKIWQGANLISKKIKLPWTLGFDICGEVTEIGGTSCKFKVGARVCGMIGFPFEGGAYATHSKVDDDQLVQIPETLNYKEAITCCLSGLTAYQAYNYVSKSKNPVLVLGSTGGVGFSLMCLLSDNNKKVYSTCRDEDGYNFIRVFDSITPVYINDIGKIDKANPLDVIDLIGGDLVMGLIQSTKLNISKLITIPTYSQVDIAKEASEKGIDVHHFIVKQSTDDILKLLEVMTKKKFILNTFKKFSLSEVKEVFETFEQRSFKGKILLTP